MKKVLLFGSFDILHNGHRHLLEEASTLGQVHIILARDETIMKVKKRRPYYTEEVRYANLQKEKGVYAVHFGSLTDKFAKIQEIAPDIIYLGYDQMAFVDELPCKLKEFGLTPVIIRGKPYYPERYKSSLLRSQLEK